MLGDHFPQDLRQVLTKHMANPKASSAADPKLVMALRSYDKNDLAIPLSVVQIEAKFTFNGKSYIKLQKRRTRIMCKELESNKLYLIHGAALVETI